MTLSRSLSLFLLFLATLSANGAMYTVTTVADSGPGSLRQGILDANSGVCASPCTINFDGPLPMVIEPLSPLPDITAARVVIAPEASASWSVEINGSKAASGSGLRFRGSGGSVRAMVINGFAGSGIVVDGGSEIQIGSNVIGLNRAGTQPVPNRQNGISIIRGTNVWIDSNTISGNAGNGVYAADSSGLSFGLNKIGIQYLPQGSGDKILPNGASGIFLHNVHDAHVLGNVIAHNALAGVAVTGDSTAIRLQDRSLPSLIHSNGLMQIDYGFDGVTPNSPGRALNTPVLTRTEVSGTFMLVGGSVQTTPGATIDLNVFSSDTRGPFDGHAKIFRHAETVTADSSGRATFELRFGVNGPVVGQWISATATTEAGTSELSQPVTATTNESQLFKVITTGDSGPGSLRQAILDANAAPCSAAFPCLIRFDLPPPVPASGYYTISVRSPLPPITRSGVDISGEEARGPYDFGRKLPRVEIDGSQSTPGPGLTVAAVHESVIGVRIIGLAINGFRGDGIVVDATAGQPSPEAARRYIVGVVILGNFIGTDGRGAVARPNTGAGIRVRGDVPFFHAGTFGSSNGIRGNLISGNRGHGVVLEGASFVELEANFIGTDFQGRQPIPNGGSGLYVANGAQSHAERNTFAFNRKAGVTIVDATPAVFNGIIENSIHSNVGLNIDVRDDGVITAVTGGQTPPEITSATYDPATKTATVTGSFVRTAAFPGWTPKIDFFASEFPEIGGRGAGERIFSLYVSKATDEGGGRFSFVATGAQQDLRGLRIAATATPFNYNGWKGEPQPNVFGQGFQYGTTSEMSQAVAVVTTGCPTAAPEPVSPKGEVPVSTVEFRWNAVAGASSYNVWMRPVGGVPTRIANSAGTSVHIALESGSFEWFVEAVYGECPGVKSEAVSLDVRAARRRMLK